MASHLEKHNLTVTHTSFHQELFDQKFQGTDLISKHDICIMKLNDFPGRQKEEGEADVSSNAKDSVEEEGKGEEDEAHKASAEASVKEDEKEEEKANDTFFPVSRESPTKLASNQHVVGTSLSGTVHGKCLEYDPKGEVYSFVADFCGPGNSGTLMFVVGRDKEPKAIGCFKRTKNMKAGMRQRGLVVLIPKDIKWLRVEKICAMSLVTSFRDGEECLEKPSTPSKTNCQPLARKVP